MRLSAIAMFLALLIGCSSRLPVGSVDSAAAVSAGPGVLSPSNTRINFVGTALLASHEGTFTRFKGKITAVDSDLKNVRITADIQMDSVHTQIPLLTKHLKEADFFDAVKYPTASFVSTRISSINANGADFLVTGNFTLHGTNRAISFPAHIQRNPETFSMDAKFTIRQSDFKMESARTTSDEVVVSLSVRALLPVLIDQQLR